MAKLCVIIPVYNEAATIKQVLEKIHVLDIDKEIIVVDDGSRDETKKVLREVNFPNLKVIHHTSNRGKGAAILTGLAHAQGDLVIIQDADLEYEPNDYKYLLQEKNKQNADVVLGARFTKGYHGSFVPRLGNRILTSLLNFLFGVKINDCFTCYKLIPRETLQSFNLVSRSFDVEIEIIAKAVKKKLKIVEVPVSYQPRTYAEGKKIRWKDGIRAICTILRYRFFN